MKLEELEVVETLRNELEAIEKYTQGYTLADAMREGSSVTGQKTGHWYSKDNKACALSAAYLAAKARGII
jgi:hypothetical protein